ncbi:SDR family NAD(P)-dependent oxidoreductase [Geodermatophilus sp. DF01-2]|uniref:SDR family NAD(P)-dependent oxidoreductase n=1 Tax=Geodermatophilus sp. DF01-2 TaxID=2559610 RepID=UPI0010742C80|nr:SDR family NAD(P)-dependent oxidoreductase [Geodermatophilus sp. DF01_2]TFV59829.1 SDR family NAD(P)-dependent oxidoreductase [Geodermatophilus sp. DF01_2]
MSYQVSSVAMVTGASSGIGAALARRLATEGRDLVLVGRRADRLRTAVPGAAEPELLAVDLAVPDGVAAVADRLAAAERPVDLLIHAAGLTTALPFGVAALDDELAQLQVNVVATTQLLHAAMTAMQARGGGQIVVVGSTAAHWSSGSYAASKAWLEVLAGALADRTPTTDVQVLVVRPGFTRTDLHERAGIDNSGVPGWMWLAADRVAAETLSALRAGRRSWTPTRRYRALVAATAPLPRHRRSAVLRRLAPLRPR